MSVNDYFHDLLRRIARRILRSEPIGYVIGANSLHNSLVDSLTPNMVTIGANFVSAPGSIILAHDSSTFNHVGAYRIEPTVIGDNVFLGANAVVLPGVNVGDGAIIGAGSVVVKDVPPGMVVAGNPAKILSTVEDYIRKCNERDCLIAAPPGFAKAKIGRIPTSEDRKELQRRAKKHYCGNIQD